MRKDKSFIAGTQYCKEISEDEVMVAFFNHYSNMKLHFITDLFKYLLNCMRHHLNGLTWHFNINAELVVL